MSCELVLEELITEAFGLTKIQIAGPAWLKSEMFSVKAVMPPKTNRETARRMLQDALADRFGLTFHDEQRDVSVYALLRGKHGVKLEKAADVEHRTKALFKTPTGSMSAFQLRNARSLRRSSDVARHLGEHPNRLRRSPVINMTGLTEEYKIDVQWKPMNSPRGIVSGNDPDLVTAVQEQLGLRLVKHKSPYKMFVIDHVERTPVSN